MLSCVPYNKLKFIILKLEIKLIKIIIKDTISKILCIKIKNKILNAEYKEPIYKEVLKNIKYFFSYFELKSL